MFILLFSIACGSPGALPDAAPEHGSLSNPEARVPATLSARIDIELIQGEAHAISELQGTLTLLESKRSTHQGPDGGRWHTSAGVLELTREGATEQLKFTSGKGFDAWGHKMAVFGSAGDLQLSIYPPGDPVLP